MPRSDRMRCEKEVWKRNLWQHRTSRTNPEYDSGVFVCMYNVRIEKENVMRIEIKIVIDSGQMRWNCELNINIHTYPIKRRENVMKSSVMKWIFVIQVKSNIDS